MIRLAVAIFGGYALAALTAAMLALALPVVLPMERAASVLIGTMLSFVIFVGAAIWTFAARSLRSLWLELVLGLLAAAVLLLACWSIA